MSRATIMAMHSATSRRVAGRPATAADRARMVKKLKRQAAWAVSTSAACSLAACRALLFCDDQ